MPAERAAGMRDAGKLFPQIVEAKLVAGAIDDVAGINVSFLLLGGVFLQYPDRAIQQLINGRQQFAVASGKVGVRRGNMHALAAQGIENRRQGGTDGLSLSGGHFRDHSAAKDHSRDDLFIVQFHSEDAPNCFISQSKRLDHAIRGTFRRLGSESRGESARMCRQLAIGEIAQSGHLLPHLGNSLRSDDGGSR